MLHFPATLGKHRRHIRDHQVSKLIDRDTEKQAHIATDLRIKVKITTNKNVTK